MAKVLTGTVSSTAPNKTIVITVVTKKTHPIYKKQYISSTKFMAHDENNDCNVGDLVTIEETKPISARKRFKLKKILEKAQLSEKDLSVIEGEDTASEKDAEEDK